MPDLSAAQNQRLREAIQAHIGPGKRFATPAAFARAMEMAQPSLWQFLNDEKRGLSPKKAEKLASMLGVSVEDLLGPSEASMGAQRDMYPSRARAILWARQEGLPESAIQEVMSRTYPADPGGEQWMRDLLETAHRHRLRAALEGRPVELPLSNKDTNPDPTGGQTSRGSSGRSGARSRRRKAG